MDVPKVLVVGSANVDLVTRLKAIPRPGETVFGTSFATVMGGKGANQAVASARLGARTWFAGCVGRDAFGDMQRSSLAAEGIDLTYLKSHASEPTGTAVILVSEEGQNSIVVTPAANAGILPEDIDAMRPLFDEVDAVVLQLEIPLATVEAVLDAARAAGVLSVLDAGPAQKVEASLLHKADVVSPNESEAEALTGVAVDSEAAAVRAAEALRDRGVGEVVLKLGARGAYYLGPEGRGLAPAFTITPVDTTAAGDAFTAALASVWRRLPWRDALRYANGAGALAATVAGAQPSMPRREALAQFLATHPA